MSIGWHWPGSCAVQKVWPFSICTIHFWICDKSHLLSTLSSLRNLQAVWVCREVMGIVEWGGLSPLVRRHISHPLVGQVRWLKWFIYLFFYFILSAVQTEICITYINRISSFICSAEQTFMHLSHLSWHVISPMKA